MKKAEMPYIQAAQGKRPERMPIVIEIQSVTAPSNKKLREKYGPEKVWKNPELSARCTVAPIAEVGYDAAIHVSDMSILIEAMGLEVQPSEKGGPRILNPVRTMADVDKLAVPEPEEAMKVWLEAMRIAKKELAGKVPLLGWVGGPLSVASFMIEGGVASGTTPYHNLKTMMHAEPAACHKLFQKLTQTFVRFIPCQVDAGADAMMILDLRAPAVISPDDFRQFSFPYIKELVRAVKGAGVPVMLHSDGTSFMGSPVDMLNVDVLGLSWTVDLAEAIRRFDGRQVVQGNLEPYVLFAPDAVIEEKVRNIVASGKKAPAHIFSLGGWIIPTTPFEKVKFLVDLVHSL